MSSSLRPDAPCFVPVSFLKQKEEKHDKGFQKESRLSSQRKKAPRRKNEGHGGRSNPLRKRSQQRRGEEQLQTPGTDNTSSTRRTQDQFRPESGNKGQTSDRGRGRRNYRDCRRKKPSRVREASTTTTTTTEPLICNAEKVSPSHGITSSVTNNPLDFPALGPSNAVPVEDRPSVWRQSQALFENLKMPETIVEKANEGDNKIANPTALPRNDISAFTVLVSKRSSRRTDPTIINNNNDTQQSEQQRTTPDHVIADSIQQEHHANVADEAEILMPSPTSPQDSDNTVTQVNLQPLLQPLPSRRYNMSRLRDRWWDLVKNAPIQQQHPQQDSIDAIEKNATEEAANITNKQAMVEHYAPVEIISSTIITSQHEQEKSNKHYLEPHYACAQDPILEAIRRNDIEALRILMKETKSTTSDDECNGEDPDSYNGGGGGEDMSAIQLATHLDRPNLLRFLISWARKGSILLKENPEFPPALFIAAERGYDECLQLLIALGPSWLITRDRVGNNVLHIACGEHVPTSVLEIILCSAGGSLVKLMTSTNHRRQNPMHMACSNGRVDLVDMLLSTCSFSLLSKALLVQDRDKQTPLLVAVDAGATDVVMSLLMWRGNNHLYTTTSTGAPCPLRWAVRAQNVEMVQLLLEFNDPTGGGYDLTSALRRAITDRATANESNGEVMLTIIRVLVNSGANPCCCDTSGDNTSAVEMAVEQYDATAICVLLDSYDTYLRHLRRNRRRDPVLHKQPESFFAGLESKENAERTVALRSALVLSLFYCVSRTSHLVQQFYSCALVLYRRSACLGHLGFSNLCSSLASGSYKPVTSDASPLSRSLLWHFEARYNHLVGPFQHPKEKDNNLSYWSRVLRKQPFALMDVGCAWWESEPSVLNGSVPALANEMLPRADFILITDDGSRFETHSAIVCQKSEKMGAAFRFISTGRRQDNSCDYDDGSNMCVETSVDLSRQMCLWFLHHIYHGSLPSSVWALDSFGQVRHNLLELLVIGEEFMCPSLVQECEVRLLLSAEEEQRCYCWHCCSRTGPIEDGKAACCYGTEPRNLFCTTSLRSIRKQDGTVDVESVLDVLAVAQQVGDSIGSCRDEEHCSLFVAPEDGMMHSKTKLLDQTNTLLRLQPLEALRMFATIFILDNFYAVVQSSSFRSHVDLGGDFTPNAKGMASVEEATSQLLLQMCLEEFLQSSLLLLSNPEALNSSDCPKTPACSTNGTKIRGW